MPTNIFIKRNGSLEVQHRQVDSVDLKSLEKELDEAFGPGSIFLEDEDEPLAATRKIDAPSIFIHHSRCKHIAVSVRYAGKSFKDEVGPGTTLKVLKRRAEKKLNIDEADAAELSLQIAGTTERPDESTHVGSLAESSSCSVIFDLVPSDRING
jgi:hypothetical protein